MKTEPAPRPAPSASLAAALEGRVRTFLRQLAALRTRPSAATVHDLRVSARRLVAVIDLLRPLTGGGGLVRMRRRLRRLLKELNALRDLEVQREGLRALGSRSRALGPLAAELRAREARERAAAVRRGLRFPGPALELAAAAAVEALQDAGRSPHGDSALLAGAQAAYASSYLRLMRARAQVSPGDPATLHRLRIRLKTHRYAAEILRALPGSAVRARDLQGMKRVQDALGALQDCVVLERTVTAHARLHDAGGALLPLLARLQEQRAGLLAGALQAAPAVDALWSAPA